VGEQVPTNGTEFLLFDGLMRGLITVTKKALDKKIAASGERISAPTKAGTGQRRLMLDVRM
jgi:hypothetical protein